MLSESIISSILLYSLHIISLGKNNISKLQRFYTECIRIIAGCNYKENYKQENIQKIREGNIILTAESKLNYYGVNTHCRLRDSHSTAFLGDKEYVNKELKHSIRKYAQ